MRDKETQEKQIKKQGAKRRKGGNVTQRKKENGGKCDRGKKWERYWWEMIHSKVEGNSFWRCIRTDDDWGIYGEITKTQIVQQIESI